MEHVLKDWKIDGGSIVNVKTGEYYAFKEIDRGYYKDREYGEDNFAKLYFQGIRDFPVLRPAEQKLFWQFVVTMDYRNIVRFDTYFKDKFMEKYKYSYDTVSQAVSSLYKHGICHKLNGSMVQVNPRYLAKGHSWDIVAMKLTLVKVDDKVFKISEMGLKEKK